ncbi:hypothetical protein ACTVZO_04070 [Streptomyces sp. IBSNAI002]|uniref:hypothetical protein n=1 Tax=Streptomyces sp. IBSNAI002 TaxID=3457500 RepID=UPI003FD2F623
MRAKTGEHGWDRFRERGGRHSPPHWPGLLVTATLSAGAELLRGEGRSGTGFSVRRAAEHTYVIPQDALRGVRGAQGRAAALWSAVTGRTDARPAGAKGLISATPMSGDGFSAGVQPESERSLPLAATQYLSATGVRWAWTASQLGAEGEERMICTKGPVAYKPATRHALTFNTGVVGPDPEASDDQGATRYGDYIDSRVQLFNDGSGHSGSSVVTGGFARLESGGRVIAEGPATGCLSAEVPAGSAAYRLSMAASRSAEDTSISTKVAVAWTFTSARPPGEEPARPPLSTVRLSPELSLGGTAAAAGRPARRADRRRLLRRGSDLEAAHRDHRLQGGPLEGEAPGGGHGRVLPGGPQGQERQHDARDHHERLPARAVR